MDTCDNDESQCPALVWATWHGHSQIVTWLLEHGANVNVTNAFGNTPLHYAAHWADSHEHGASGCQGNCCNCTDKKLPPHCGNVQDCGGGSSQHMECLKVLIQHGADQTLKDKAGQLAVNLACDKQARALLHPGAGAGSTAARTGKRKAAGGAAVKLSADISNGQENFAVPAINECGDGATVPAFDYIVQSVAHESETVAPAPCHKLFDGFQVSCAAHCKSGLFVSTACCLQWVPECSSVLTIVPHISHLM
jgi:hypothetical protein